MQTSSETNELFDELFDRLSVLADLDGPQIEAWVSGLFPMLDETLPLDTLIERCAATGSPIASLVCAALAELTSGLDDETSAAALAAVRADSLPPTGAQIGASDLAEAWEVDAPFGRSIVLGFTNRAQVLAAVTETPENQSPETQSPGTQSPGTGLLSEDAEPVDLRHSILVEIGPQGQIEDLQLAGPAKELLKEAAAADERVSVRELEPADAVAQIVHAWPEGATNELGLGFAANQQFVRRRIVAASAHVLPLVLAGERQVDVRRGLDDEEFLAANRAALSTLRSAFDLSGIPRAGEPARELSDLEQAWVGVIRGTGGELSARERDALLWLEWADWLGAGLGLLRAGAESAADGATLVDHVNRCPEVSSSIDKRDRDYAEWAFEVALDLLADAGVIDQNQLTPAGHAALAPALVAAWTD